MKKLFTLAILTMLSVASQAQVTRTWWWNSVGNLLSASKWNPADTYEVDGYVVATGRKYYNDEWGGNNTSNLVYNHVWGVPPQDSEGREWYDPNYQLTDNEEGGYDEEFDVELPSSYWRQMRSPINQSGSYNGMSDGTAAIGDYEPGDFYGRRTFTFEDGTILPSVIYLSCGHDDAPAEYYINGVLVWSKTGFESGNGWNESEIYKLTTEQRNLIHDDGTPNVLAYHVHQNWGGFFADCGLYGEPQSYKFIVPTADILKENKQDPWTGYVGDYGDTMGYDGVGEATEIEYSYESDMEEIQGALSDQAVPNSISANYQACEVNTPIDIVVRRHFTIDEELPRDGWEYYVVVGHDDVFTLWLNGSNGEEDDSKIKDEYGNVLEGSGNRSYTPMPLEWINNNADDEHVVVPYTGNCWVDYPSKRARKLTDEQIDLLNVGGEDNVFTAHAQNTTGGFYVDMGIVAIQTKLDAAVFIEQIQELLVKVNDIDRSIKTKALLAVLDEAVANAKEMLANDEATVKMLLNIVGDLQDAYDKIKDVDITVLKETVAIASKEETKTLFAEVVAAGETAIEEALSQTELDNALDALRLARRIVHAETSEWTGTTAIIPDEPIGEDETEVIVLDPREAEEKVIDDEPVQIYGEYYLYNVGAKRWLQGGGDWGAHASVGYPGIPVTIQHDKWGDTYEYVVKVEEGEFVSYETEEHEGNEDYKYYAIDTNLNNSRWGYYDHLGHNGYMDTAGNAWMFWLQGNGTYVISRNGEADGDNDANGEGTKNLLGYDPTTYDVVNTNRVGADDPNNQWILVTKEQRDALFANADENGVEATHLIAMPGFNQRERLAGSDQSVDELPWSFEGSNIEFDHYADNNGRHIIFERGYNHDDFVVDVYEMNNFKMSQELFVENGWYRVAVDALYRANEPTGDEAIEGWEDPHANCVLYAAGDTKVTKPILNENAGRGWYPGVGADGVPTTGFEATRYFQVGQYYQYVDVQVTGGVLEIGVEKNAENYTPGECLWVDNFRLWYYGANEPSGINELEAVKSNTNGRIYNINGQYEGQNVNSLQKGIHIVDGKKIVK